MLIPITTPVHSVNHHVCLHNANRHRYWFVQTRFAYNGLSNRIQKKWMSVYLSALCGVRVLLILSVACFHTPISRLQVQNKSEKMPTNHIGTFTDHVRQWGVEFVKRVSLSAACTCASVTDLSNRVVHWCTICACVRAYARGVSFKACHTKGASFTTYQRSVTYTDAPMDVRSQTREHL